MQWTRQWDSGDSQSIPPPILLYSQLTAVLKPQYIHVVRKWLHPPEAPGSLTELSHHQLKILFNGFTEVFLWPLTELNLAWLLVALQSSPLSRGEE